MSEILKRIFWIVLLLVIVGGGYFYFKNKSSRSKYTTAQVAKGDLTQTVLATGDVVSNGQVDLSFKTSGQLIFLGVAVGDKVTKGEKIAQIDDGTLDEQIDQANAGIKLQQEILDNMKSSKNWDLFSKQQRDGQRANIVSAQAAVAVLQQELNQNILYAPNDGTIAKKNFDQGETVPANQAVVSLEGMGDLEIKDRVSEADISKIQVGQSAYALFDSLPGEKIAMTVSDIEPDVTVIQGNNYYLVTLQFASQDPRIKDGMSPDVYITTGTRSDVLTVPISAIRNDGDRQYAEVLGDDNKTIQKKYLQTGLEGDGAMVEVKSGLNQGDKVVLN